MPFQSNHMTKVSMNGSLTPNMVKSLDKKNTLCFFRKKISHKTVIDLDKRTFWLHILQNQKYCNHMKSIYVYCASLLFFTYYNDIIGYLPTSIKFLLSFLVLNCDVFQDAYVYSLLFTFSSQKQARIFFQKHCNIKFI